MFECDDMYLLVRLNVWYVLTFPTNNSSDFPQVLYMYVCVLKLCWCMVPR